MTHVIRRFKPYFRLSASPREIEILDKIEEIIEETNQLTKAYQDNIFEPIIDDKKIEIIPGRFEEVLNEEWKEFTELATRCAKGHYKSVAEIKLDKITEYINKLCPDTRNNIFTIKEKILKIIEEE